jgi:acyl-coenzyme A synthetase/AMP-(fatty) acid ligase
VKVAPVELEMLLLEHPGVADAAVIGVIDRWAGEVPKAFVVKKPDSTVSADEIISFVQG